MFDSHAHVIAGEFDADRLEVKKRALEAGLLGWIEVGTTVTESKKAVALAGEHAEIYASVGVHPNDIANIGETGWQTIHELVSNPKVKAVGEVGLDFHYGGTPDQQLPVLRQFIQLAQERELPVIFHVRNGKTLNAHDELLKLLESYPDDMRPLGVIHTYSGTLQQAKKYIELGFYLSFSGVITFKNAGELLEVAKMVPADKILVETDCPFLTPVPHRGERNEPAYVQFVVQKLAEIRGESVEQIAAQTVTNTKQLFSL